jgi:hypothetical protein
MPAFGGMSPFPMKFGGGKPRVQVILEGLNSDRGTAFEAGDRTKTVYVENMALARALSATWGTNQRLANMWVPRRMSWDVLKRWEKIMAIFPLPTDTESVRRDRIEALLARFGRAAINGYIVELLTDALGDAFSGVEYISYANAAIHVPDGTYPWGTVLSGRPWSSTVAHILIKMQKPAGWTERDFYNAAGKVFPLLEPVLPIWTTFDWYRGPDSGAVSVSGGPSAAGWFLDADHNFDAVFDV